MCVMCVCVSDWSCAHARCERTNNRVNCILANWVRMFDRFVCGEESCTLCTATQSDNTRATQKRTACEKNLFRRMDEKQIIKKKQHSKR